MPDLTDLRDELAGLCGWHVPDSADPYWEKGGRVEHRSFHPFPDGSIDALAAVWPEGWAWERTQGTWRFWRVGVDGAGWGDVLDTGDEYADRLRLTLAVLKAGKEAGGD